MSRNMDEVVVVRKRTKYKRKNNPAVELMRRVMAAKKLGDLDALPFYSYRLYEKQTTSLNELGIDSATNKFGGALGFLGEYAETCKQTGKTILPLLIEEKDKQRVHRLDPRADKTYVLAQRSSGLNDLLSLGGQLNTVLNDVFQDINIYEDDIRLFQRHFLSPLAGEPAIRFYCYYIEDTLKTEPLKQIRLYFTPNNPRDFGFSGSLIVEDSTWQVVHCEINIPSRSCVNFVDNLRIMQRFETLDCGQRVITANDMLVQMSVAEALAKVQVQRTTRRTDFSFDSIPAERFRGLAKEIVDAQAEKRDNDYWLAARPLPLTNSEARIDSMVHQVEKITLVRVMRFFLNAYGQNFIELKRGGGPVDIGPIRSLVTYNSIEGVRLLVGAQTTAKMSEHWFLKGYLGYGCRDRRFKGLADVTYSFNVPKYRPHEFPMHSLSVCFSEDLLSMSDRKLGENRNDFLSIFEWGRRTDYKLYQRKGAITYNKEWENGLLITAQAMKERITPAGDLAFTPVGAAEGLRHFDNTELKLTLRYQPNNTYINSKRHRYETNKDAPIYQLTHTVSPDGLWGNRCWSNMTDFELYRRVWLSSWGRMDFTLRGAWQWNRVPFLQLSTPDANKSYVMMRRRFCLMEEMEFLSDHNLSLHWKWDLAGKIFNRIPLLRRLKWRETIGFNALWGELSDRNNPSVGNKSDGRLWALPSYSYALDPKCSYVEAYAGIFNIFSFFNVTYVHRFTYNNHPDTSRWGIRVGMELSF